MVKISPRVRKHLISSFSAAMTWLTDADQIEAVKLFFEAFCFHKKPKQETNAKNY